MSVDVRSRPRTHAFERRGRRGGAGRAGPGSSPASPPPPRLPRWRRRPDGGRGWARLWSNRTVLWVLVAGLLALAVGVWTSPPMRRWGRGPTEVEVDLAIERARSDDLKRKLDEAEERLRAPRPPATDGVAAARAEDLAARLADAEERLRAPRPPVTDGVAAARADDLARRVQHLSAQLARPRPIVEPPVVATMTKAEIVAARNQFGLYTPQSPFNLADVNAVEAAVGRRANIVGYFQSWRNEFRPDAIRDAWRHGAVPLLTWESRSMGGLGGEADDPEFSLPVILGGRYDDYLRRWARGISELGMPLILRFDHEMNAPWYPWAEISVYAGGNVNGNRRGDYVRTWRHVHDIFEEEGANRYVVWLWSPNRVNMIPLQPAPIDFYPGDEYVDWIGMSGYYRFYDPEPTFEETFGQTLPLLREAAATKPIFLAEIGATEIGEQKVVWITDLFGGLRRNPDIIGFAWFNFTVSSDWRGELYTNDWRIDSSAPSIQAMRHEMSVSKLGRPLG